MASNYRLQLTARHRVRHERPQLKRSVEDAEKIFLKTIIPGRKVTEIYLREKNERY